MDFKNNAAPITLAWMFTILHFPAFGSFDQFGVHILSLVEQPNGTAGQEGFGIVEKQGQRREGPGHDTLNLRNIPRRLQRLEPDHVNLRSGLGLAGGFPQESGLLAIAFI